MPGLRLPRAMPKTVPVAIAALVGLAVALFAFAPVPNVPPAQLDGGTVRLRAQLSRADEPIRPPPPSPRFCADDSGCDGGRCLDGRCGLVRTGSCKRDADCPEGRCLADGCEVGERDCDIDADCEAGQRCDRGLCLEGARSCGGDDDCGRRERCAAGRCREGARDCVRDRDCPSGKVCDEGGCTTGPVADGASACHNDTACGSGHCSGGRCRPGLRGCLDDRDCPPGTSCTEGRCALPRPAARP